MRTSFIETLCELAEKDERIWLLCGDLGFSVLECFISRFPKRFVNVGVAEQNMAGIAAGLAMSGKIVFTYSIANFPTLRCLEQIRNDICYHKANVKIVAVGGGFAYGAQGATHHGLEDLAILRTLPNMTVTAPADPVESKAITKLISELPGPCYLRLGKAGEPVVHQTKPDFTVGKMIPVKDGRDALIISTGGMLITALEAQKQTEAKGFSVGVWSSPWLKPFDNEGVMKAAERYPVIISLEEAQVTGGLGSAIASVVAGLKPRHCQVISLGVPDIFLEKAYCQQTARNQVGLDTASITKTIIDACQSK
ncbi:MAG: transketolase [Candidatus Omnitrophica bacterium]|nr:transketolase [Candidatus Omnitrophota bacterium]